MSPPPLRSFFRLRSLPPYEGWVATRLKEESIAPLTPPTPRVAPRRDGCLLSSRFTLLEPPQPQRLSPYIEMLQERTASKPSPPPGFFCNTQPPPTWVVVGRGGVATLSFHPLPSFPTNTLTTLSVPPGQTLYERFFVFFVIFLSGLSLRLLTPRAHFCFAPV